jgi:hypothetical protein
MYQCDLTIRATAGRAEADAHRYNREENIPTKWLGTKATWRERRIFDWSYLERSAERSGNSELAEYARARGSEYLLK